MQKSSLSSSHSASAVWLALAILATAILLAYSNSLNGPFILDDESSIVENPSIHSWRTVLFPPGNSGLTVSGRPMVNVSLAINYALGGMNVWGYHAFNIGVHLLATFALFGLVRRTLLLSSLREKYASHSWWLALAAAAVWGLHPLQTESVTYMIQRAESIVSIFYILTLYYFVRSVEAPGLMRHKVAVVLSCMLGMASKEVMVTAPVVVFLFDRVFVSGSFTAAWKERRGLYIGMMATWIILAACIISTGKRGSTVGFNAEVGAWRYALTQCHAIIHYLRLVVWPNPLVLDYGGPLAGKFADVAFRAVLLGMLVIGSLLLFWRKPKAGFLPVCFFLLLAPTSSIVPVLTQTVAEHRMYLPLAPLAVLAVVVSGVYFSGRLVYFWLAVGLVLGVRTHVRNHDYRSAVAIWTAVTENCAYNVRGWNSLALTYTTQGDLEKAREAAEMALKVRPNDADTIAGYANALVRVGKRSEAEKYFKHALDADSRAYEPNYNYGVLLLEDKRLEKAALHFKAAIAARPEDNVARYNLGKTYVELKQLDDAVDQFRAVVKNDPKAADARNNLANTLLGLEKVDEAVSILREGIVLLPHNSELQRTLGLSLITLGHFEEAVTHLQKAVALDKGDAKAHANLGLALVSIGRAKEACVQYEAALAVPDGLDLEMRRAVHISCGTELLKLGEIAQAKEHFGKAVDCDPANVQVRYAVADVLMQSGQVADAVAQLETAILREPAFAEAHCALGLAYARQGRADEARAAVQKSIQLDPGNQVFRDSLLQIEALSTR